VDPWELIVDEASAADLLERICGLSVRAGDAPPAAARAIRAALGAGCLPLSRLARCLLSKRWEEIQAVALRLGIDAEGMCFFIYHGIVPSLANHARVLAAGIAGTTALERGTCPVCGSPPAIAALNSLGERHMSCSLCRYQWRAPRLFCPSCGTGEGRELEYFYTEEEKEYRVTICSRCRRYLKTVDTRQMERPCYAPLEDVASWHLDMMARQAGFLSMSPQFDRTPFSPLQGMPDGREWNDETYDFPHRFRSG
jgi:FdhE protein